MEPSEQNGHNNTRMDRLEKLMDLLITDHLSVTDEHKRLLTAQVVLTDTVQQLAEAQKRAEEQLRENAEALNVLMRRMDDWIRNRPNS
jgi:hypothetical protein